MTNSSVGAVSGVRNYNVGPYEYGDYDDYDLSYSSYPMGMGASVFGDGFAYPMAGNNTQQSYFDQMRDYQKFNTDYSVESAQLQRNADLKINAAMERVKGAASVLKDKIVSNEQDQIEEAYINYVNTVAEAYGKDCKREEIEARAKTLYAQLNGGQTIVQDLREHGNSSFMQGLINTVTFGMYNTKSAEDNVSKITGAPVGTAEKGSQTAGKVVGAVGLGAGVGTAIGLLTTGPIGWVAGAAILGLSLLKSM